MNPVIIHMRKNKTPQPKVIKRLAGKIEFRDGQYVFVPDRLLKPERRIVDVPYWTR